MNEEKNRKAKELLNFAVMELKSNYSEFLYPLSVLKFKEAPPDCRVDGIATDGVTIYYNPDMILRQCNEMTMKQIMHIILHGLLGHFQMKDEYEQRKPRDLMMDLQVDYLLWRMGGVADWRRCCQTDRLNELVQGDYSMSSYYRLLEEKENTWRWERYQFALQVDDHAMWDKDMSEAHRRKVQEIWGEIQQVVLGEEGEEIDAFESVLGNLIGKETGGEKNTFGVGVGSGKNYKEFLKELFRMKEINREEPDSIDYMFYQYGLDMYGDVPLIEPLEVVEKPSLHTLAIAVDVSGSCANDEIMESFWGETYDCISQVRGQHVEGEVLLLQCDSEIQEEQRICLEDFNGKPGRIRVKGFGGTSFVPVFERLAELAAEDVTVDALIYLTDGCGDYPEEKPEYPVYFVLPKNDWEHWYVKEHMPEWIEKICLE